MKRKIGIGVILTVFLMIVLFVFSRNPVVSSDIEIPVSYMEAVKEHAEGLPEGTLVCIVDSAFRPMFKDETDYTFK